MSTICGLPTIRAVMVLSPPPPPPPVEPAPEHPDRMSTPAVAPASTTDSFPGFRTAIPPFEKMRDRRTTIYCRL
jgi:hypothetical protein